MVRAIYYDRKDVSDTEVQFFDVSRTKATRKEFDTNMELDSKFSKKVTIKKITAQLNPFLLSSTISADASVDDEIVRMLNDMIIQLQIGDMSVKYYPFIEALGGIVVQGDLEYTQGTASDASYSVLSINRADGKSGLDVNEEVNTDETIKFFVKSASTPALGTVTMVLEVEE